MHLGKLFQRTVNRHGARPALAIGRQPAISYSDLDLRVRALAHWFRHELRLKAGDRITLVLKNRLEYAEALLAAWHADLCAVPVNHRLHRDEVDYILQNSDSRVCLVDAELYDSLLPLENSNPNLRLVDVSHADFTNARQGPRAERDRFINEPDNPAWLFYTSGTTGRPKGVVLSHANLVHMALNFFADVQSVEDDDVLLHVAPMSHGSGLYSVPYMLQGALQVVPESGGFDITETIQLLQHYRKVSLFAAPTIVQRLSAHVQQQPAPLEGLRCVTVAGAPFYVADIKNAVTALGPRVAQIYGQGESPMSITAQTAKQIGHAVQTNDDVYLASVGHPQTSIEVFIQRSSDVVQNGDDEPGEIIVTGPTVMQGYWNNPQASRATLAGGRLHTGDIGLIDERGLLHLIDRSKDIVISGGSNIYPREVEEVLMQHAHIAEVSVVGVPDQRWGETVVAIVVLRPGAQVRKTELDALCLQHMARFKRPRHYLFVEELPKNATGKVLKRELQQWVSKTLHQHSN